MKTQTVKSKKYVIVTKCIVMIIIGFFSVAQCIAQGNGRDIIARANFIFSGTIVKMNASNINVAPNGPTMIVRVEEVIDAVPPYDEMKGKEITVLPAKGQNVRAGLSRVFYTMGWYYGKTLGVKEIPNNFLTPEKLTALKEKITTERVNITNDSLFDELKKARLVVQGTVVETGINVEFPSSLESEHNPEIKKAIIEIKTVLKGRMSERRVTVSYASSDDVMWYNSPKLVKGQEGIFLLQMGQAPAIFKVQGYTILDRRDFQPLRNINLVQTLLKK